MASTVSEAITAVDQFEATLHPTPWKLSQQQFCSRLRELLQNPFSLDQGNLNLCGPACMMALWCFRDPLAFAIFCMTLYESGKGAIGNLLVEPGEDLLNQDYFATSQRMNPICRPAEWMAMSALRDSSNTLFDFEGTPEEDASAVTLPNEISEWLGQTGFYSSVDEDGNFFFVKSLDHAVKLSPGTTGDIIILVNAQILPKQVQAGPLDITRFFPNHYIILTSPVSVAGDQVSFNYWSWGEFGSADVPRSFFESNYYGAIEARF